MNAGQLLALILQYGPGLESLVHQIITDFGSNAEITDETIQAADAKLKAIPPAIPEPDSTQD